jgi:predicted nucleic acid-binding protein
VLVLDSGGVSRLAERSTRAAAIITVFKREGLWPPVVPSVVLVECLSGRRDRDARTNKFLKACDIEVSLSKERARRAAWLRGAARRGSAVDAIVVAIAEPGGTVYGGDVEDLQALAARADDVMIERA